ncbi:MAG: acyl-ACP--UDP-N-acetylglucosamine O-acyltransferase [Candidatus Omnitrophica bacterium]|nr:acyl-ACP--UDP-N-acetylglucosamine O-acyltransferase [Candidatus Omnitrophota bacterium]MDD5610105.1 acyl-ACP--UDP-N-acetylglucosamine O-acyltransferase [Candidatus Omnitrophota bacterium]
MAHIHSQAICSKSARLADDVEVGPYTVIGDNVSIAGGTQIGAFCVIDGHTAIGKNCRIFTGAVVGSVPQDLKYKGEISYLEVGDGNIIREYCTLNVGTGEGGKTTVGNNNLIMAYSHVAHDCVVGNDCIIANGGTLAGHVTIEDKAVVGGLVAIHQFTRIGKLSIIGGCSKVVQDVPPFSTSDGHPTRTYGLNLVGLRRAGLGAETISNLKHAFKLLFNSELAISHAVEKILAEVPAGDEISYLINFIKNSKRGIC